MRFFVIIVPNHLFGRLDQLVRKLARVFFKKETPEALYQLSFSKNTELTFGRLAQLVERQPYKLDVTGSSPVPPTKIKNIT
jgi:hypothetical protein